MSFWASVKPKEGSFWSIKKFQPSHKKGFGQQKND